MEGEFGQTSHTSSIASSTLLRLSICFTTTATAVLADDVFRRSEACGFALVQFLERNLIFLHLVLALSGPSASHSTHSRHATHTLETTSHSSHAAHTLSKHLRQDVVQVWSCTSSCATLFKGGHAVHVVHFSGLVITEDLVGLLDILETVVCGSAVGFGDLVWVVDASGLVVGLFHFGFCSIAADFEDLVEVDFGRHDCGVVGVLWRTEDVI